MGDADRYKARAEEVGRMAEGPNLTEAEREAFRRIVKEWLALEAAARARTNRR